MFFYIKVPLDLHKKRKAFALSFLLISAGLMNGCANPVMGAVSDGVYAQPHGNFSCPLVAESIGLSGAPEITDAYRVTQMEHVPLSQRAPGDWKANKVVSDEVRPSPMVRFVDASGTVIEISSGVRAHSVEMALADGMSGGSSWLFDKREIAHPSGRMVSGLMLVPWHEEGLVYMGMDIAESYRQGQGPDAQLWIRSNLVIGSVLHTITVKRPVAPVLGQSVHPRDLPGIRDAVNARPELKDALFAQVNGWLERCTFSRDVK